MLLSPAVEAAATAAIAERGHFALAIPGGSVLKMLAGSTPSWAAQTTLAYVNHKCVAMDDAALATHAKARAGFLDAGWAGVNAIVLSGSGDASAEAKEYSAQLAALPADQLPRTADGLPCFDMAIIGESRAPSFSNSPRPHFPPCVTVTPPPQSEQVSGMTGTLARFTRIATRYWPQQLGCFLWR